MSGVVHDFKRDLARSHEVASEPWWEQIYRHFFPSFASMVFVDDKLKQQRGDRFTFFDDEKQGAR